MPPSEEIIDDFQLSLGLKFNIGKEIKALFWKVACQSQLLGKVVRTITYMSIGYLLVIELYQVTILGSVG